jgi:polyhydroxyalkanoate synthesis regulator phasin
MAEPKDLVLPLLREIQADLAAFRKETGDRLTKLEAGQRNIRSALAGETVLSRMLIGEYEERIEALEQKVGALEGRK